MDVFEGWNNRHAADMSVTKRFSDRWQASATYGLGWYYDGQPNPRSGLDQVTFDVPPPLGEDYSLGAGDQRHRLEGGKGARGFFP